MLPTLDKFLSMREGNSYVDHPHFSMLYVRKWTVPAVMDGEFWYCTPTLTIANVLATTRNAGAFTRLVDFLSKKDLAIYVENVQTERFANGLRRMGFKQVNLHTGVHFLKYFEGRLTKEARFF